MKNTAVKYLVIATVLLMLPVAALGHDAPNPHNPSAYSCDECHNITHNDLGTQGMWTNLCVSCHKPGSPDSNAKNYYVRTFNYGDQANPYKNNPALTENPNTIQMSHRWEGSDTVPEAGAQAPSDVRLSPVDKLMLQDNLYCQRCHNFVTKFREGADYSAPFLRARIDEDQMCYDCHKTRGEATSHLAGTHPVNGNYSAVRAANPDKYYRTPENANPANPTSQLKMKKGKLVCMTCHGVHYTDSNSATFDKFSTAIQGQLSTSRGYLLKTDYKRGSVTERNICMNCHRSRDYDENPNGAVKNHNGKKKQNIQCTDCHGGHVEFAGYSTAAGGIPQSEKTPNIYLINRLMNISSSTGAWPTVRNAKVIYTDPVNKNYNRNSAGVCIVCHKGGLPPEIGSHSSTDWNECKKCHQHTNGFSANCTACHGMPPVTDTPPNPDPTIPATGYAVNGSVNYKPSPVYKDESKTPHITHAGGKDSGYYSYSCDECHKGYSPTHMTGDFQQLFRDRTGLIGSTNGGTPVYDPASPGTCRTVYCHSDGNGGYKEPQWAEKKGTIFGKPAECSSCHNMPPTTNSHTKHVAAPDATPNAGKGYSCAMCHDATVNDATSPAVPTMKNTGLHVNGTKNVQFAGFASGGTYDPATKKCSNLYCHSDGRNGFKEPKFNDPATGTCGTCHSNPMSNYGHPAHMSAVNGPQFGTDQQGACAKCHDYTNEFGPKHVNGQVAQDVVLTRCDPCHPNSDMRTWTGGAVTCESCHTVINSNPVSVINNVWAPNKTQAASTGHNNARYLNDPANPKLVCTTCHARNAQHLSSDPKVHFYRLTSSLVSVANPNVACSFCHNDATKVSAKFLNMSTHFTEKSTADKPSQHNMACWQCHELHGTSNLSMIKSEIAYINTTSRPITFLNRTDGMIDKVTNRGLCQVCHTKTNHFRNGVPEGDGHPDNNCFDCHIHNDKGGAFAAGGCNGCHGYPPVPRSATFGIEDPNNYKGTFGTFKNYTNASFEDYTGGGGAHLWHVAQNAKASDKWKHCTKCHGGGSSAPTTHVGKKPIKGNIAKVTLNFDPRFRFSDDAFPKYTSAKLVYPGNNTGSCLNISCHFQPTPRWSKDR